MQIGRYNCGKPYLAEGYLEVQKCKEVRAGTRRKQEGVRGYAGITDAVHNGIFLVADADRRRIDAGTAAPQLTDDAWHAVRVDWSAGSGKIEVYVDESTTPVLQASDSTISEGRVGFGSFDDTGEFRKIQVTGGPK